MTARACPSSTPGSPRTGRRTSSTRCSASSSRAIAPPSSTSARTGPERAVRRRCRPVRSREVEGRLRVEQGMVDGSRPVRRYNEPLPELKSFVLPGGTGSGRGSTSRERSAAVRARDARGRPSELINPLVPSTSTGSPISCSSWRVPPTHSPERGAAVEAGSVAVTGIRGGGIPRCAPARPDIVRRPCRAHRLLREDYVAPRLAGREAIRRARCAPNLLPGPSSSQLGIAIGVHRAGKLGGLAAWLGFTCRRR